MAIELEFGDGPGFSKRDSLSYSLLEKIEKALGPLFSNEFLGQLPQPNDPHRLLFLTEQMGKL